MLIKKKKLSNIAGIMGGSAAQPAALLGQSTVDPLERAQQKMAGRTQGGSVSGIKDSKTRPKRTLMTNYGIK